MSLGEDCDDMNPSNIGGKCFVLDDPCTNKDLRNKKVIATEYSLENMLWTYTTVRSVDHLGHFVSGHRQFRLRDNGNGTFIFEVRGTDRLGQRIDKTANNPIEIF